MGCPPYRVRRTAVLRVVAAGTALAGWAGKEPEDKPSVGPPTPQPPRLAVKKWRAPPEKRPIRASPASAGLARIGLFS
eukprot:970324-Alexandrium_andersonii.AAC.1